MNNSAQSNTTPIRVTEVLITPELATQWLRENINNRPIKESHVAYLAQQILRGLWKLNGETLKFSGKRLIDGQHRLHACIRANKPFLTLVVFDVDDEVFDTIDTNNTRSGSDTLAILGEKNCKRLAAAIVLVDRYKMGRMHLFRKKYSNTDYERILNLYPKLRESAARHDLIVRHVPHSVMVACHFLFSEKDDVLGEIFCESLAKGTNLNDADPVYLVREHLVRASLMKAKLPGDTIFGLIIKAWNAVREGKKVKKIFFMERGIHKEDFPIVK